MQGTGSPPPAGGCRKLGQRRAAGRFQRLERVRVAPGEPLLGGSRRTSDGDRSALLRVRSGWRLRVCSAAQHGQDLVVVFTAEDRSQPEAERLCQTIVLHTSDDGRSARELLRTQGPEEAVIAVA